MKLRAHRRGVIRKMAAAPDPWVVERVLMLGHRWRKADIRRLKSRRAPTMLIFNRIEAGRPSNIARPL